MNKEVIRKNKDVFDYWLDGGKVWHKSSPTSLGWYATPSPGWEDNTGMYVQDDEYVEFRKALADGKVIQYNAHCHPEMSGIWKRDTELRFHLPLKQYRIKPDEPKFNKGDYVINVEGKIDCITNIDHNKNISLKYDKGDYWQWKYFIDRYKPWTLESASDDEWVIGFEKGCPHSMPVLRTAYSAKNTPLDKVAPYIGQTPKELD